MKTFTVKLQVIFFVSV